MELDTVTCLWENCGSVFSHLPTLIEHIHNEHIGVHKSNYTCEWATCNRRGMAQTSRFALISHIRSHTGEKPFTCPRPECDKSFTRSDALAKHMRLQHNISPPLPGRGGNRKRKRNDDAEHPPASTSNADASSGYNTFKVDQSNSGSGTVGGSGAGAAEVPSIYDEDVSPLDGLLLANGQLAGVDYFNYPDARSPSPSSEEESVNGNGDAATNGDGEFEIEGIPRHLMAAYDSQTGLIHGRSVQMVRYLLMKAKYRYALEVHGEAVEELRVVRKEEQAARLEKEAVLNETLRATFGPQADPLLVPIEVLGPPPPRTRPKDGHDME
ncbi:hypothetical protein PUNSTDRAFT_121921 [Punctularia strigosozonata HHB-11173 SS5]|uniref:uncharacterized protein n=1 Tax=Punctularia strigosozonata (strain HHB-11173) TaxID=741275 RepID=UPI000441676A|nr:uncharacterized protein PUNSTDRAFT_121921 [Punctularia strigosozonata HHB-11173 SS5]EIN06910.1 hypothetical protein PUNSTDRAFT_121921 [Punctularia strigosozonata HHB-11173 SS5]